MVRTRCGRESGADRKSNQAEQGRDRHRDALRALLRFLQGPADVGVIGIEQGQLALTIVAERGRAPCPAQAHVLEIVGRHLPQRTRPQQPHLAAQEAQALLPRASPRVVLASRTARCQASSSVTRQTFVLPRRSSSDASQGASQDEVASTHDTAPSIAPAPRASTATCSRVLTSPATARRFTRSPSTVTKSGASASALAAPRRLRRAAASTPPSARKRSAHAAASSRSRSPKEDAASARDR